MSRRRVYVAPDGSGTLDRAKAHPDMPEPIGYTFAPGDLRIGDVFTLADVDGGEIVVDVPRSIAPVLGLTGGDAGDP